MTEQSCTPALTEVLYFYRLLECIGAAIGWEKIEYRLIKYMVQRTDVIRNLQPYIKNCIATCKYVHWKNFACSFWIDFWTFEAYLSWDFFWKKTWKGPWRGYTSYKQSYPFYERNMAVFLVPYTEKWPQTLWKIYADLLKMSFKCDRFSRNCCRRADLPGRQTQLPCC